MFIRIFSKHGYLTTWHEVGKFTTTEYVFRERQRIQVRWPDETVTEEDVWMRPKIVQLTGQETGSITLFEPVIDVWHRGHKSEVKLTDLHVWEPDLVKPETLTFAYLQNGPQGQ